MAKTVADVMKLAKEKDIKMVDLRFSDLPGQWQHFTIPAHRLDDDLFEHGIGFDGSSIRGFQEIHESDMLLLLDPDSAFQNVVNPDPDLTKYLTLKSNQTDTV